MRQFIVFYKRISKNSLFDDNDWHLIEININLLQTEYSIYVDGELCLEDEPISSNLNNPTRNTIQRIDIINDSTSPYQNWGRDEMKFCRQNKNQSNLCYIDVLGMDTIANNYLDQNISGLYTLEYPNLNKSTFGVKEGYNLENVNSIAISARKYGSVQITAHIVMIKSQRFLIPIQWNMV